MWTLIFQTLEFTVLIPGMLLAYLPVRSSLKQTPKKLAVWILPLLIICSCFCGFACHRFHLSTRSVLLPLLFVLFILYHSTLLFHFGNLSASILPSVQDGVIFWNQSKVQSDDQNRENPENIPGLSKIFIFSAFFSSFSYGIQPVK